MHLDFRESPGCNPCFQGIVRQICGIGQAKQPYNLELISTNLELLETVPQRTLTVRCMKKSISKSKGVRVLPVNTPPQTSLSPLWTRKQVADALQVCPLSIARYTKARLRCAVMELGQLPKRTMDYLKQGAPEGERNEELMAAACQCRDAGYDVAHVRSLLASRGALLLPVFTHDAMETSWHGNISFWRVISWTRPRFVRSLSGLSNSRDCALSLIPEERAFTAGSICRHSKPSMNSK